MEKLKCKVVMLPTEKASFKSTILKSNLSGTLGILKRWNRINKIECVDCSPNFQLPVNEVSSQHLYFTSNREIKVGDLMYQPHHKQVRVFGEHDEVNRHFWTNGPNGDSFKVEATTDPSLELPLIPTGFIEKYVEKQGKIDEVMIDINEIEDVESLSIYDENEIWLNGELMMCYDHRITTGRDKYLATIPFVKTRSDGTVIVSKVKDTWTRGEVSELIKSFSEEFVANTDTAYKQHDINKWINNNL